MTLEIGPPPRPRLRVALGAAVVIVIVGLVAAVVAGMLSPNGAVLSVAGGAVVDGAGGDGTAGVTIDSIGSDGGDAGESGLLVHVLGAVERPGVYRLRDGARVLDAVGAAGGLTAEAEPAGVNLARPMVDAEQLVIPRIGEVISAPAGGTVGAPPGVASNGRIDLNRADTALLETLPRIGPATAERIVRWRDEHGGFTTVEDLLAVSGIGAKTLESLRDLVTV